MSDRHRGKDPAVYVTSQIRAEAVMYKSLPRTLPPAYDWGFGVKADFKPAPHVTTILEVVDAARVFVPSTAERVDAIISFTKIKIGRMQWDADDVMELVYWVNDVLENFRSVVAGCSDIQISHVENIQDIQECRGLGLEEKAATTTPVAACSNISIAPTLTQLHFDQEEPRKDMIQVPPSCYNDYRSNLIRFQGASQKAEHTLCLSHLAQPSKLRSKSDLEA
ncbi:hypothetical protein PHMEG_00037455 [Phytophthora megakarya]|uniref:Uncharacterized protein n=1 Tax=Phytophthora megakarya TaxID=4795 RepID=A0A225UKZ5_9STRA|nr:hypothetical protein PHMEG_00037455 [Phytophthora megakarya]